jgi:2-dehydropantoate 2-reductase
VLIAIMREVLAVARAQGIDLRDADIDDQVTWTEGMPDIRTSTAVDRERGRDMEIDALIGVVSRRGRRHGVPTPVADTMIGILRALEADR